MNCNISSLSEHSPSKAKQTRDSGRVQRPHSKSNYALLETERRHLGTGFVCFTLCMITHAMLCEDCSA